MMEQFEYFTEFYIHFLNFLAGAGNQIL